MMNLTEIAFNYRKPVFMLLALMLINGALAYFSLPSQEDPTVTVREAVVDTRYSGMSPERVEELITKPLEEEIRQIAEVEKITSTSTTGQSVIHVTVYDRYFELDSIWQDLRNKVAQADLPDGASSPYVNDSFGDVSVLTLALRGDGVDLAQLRDLAKHLRTEIYTLAGTKKVEMLGDQDERIYLEGVSSKMAQLGISPQAIIDELKNQNIITPGGELDTGDASFSVEPSGNYESLEQIGETRISIPGTDNTFALKDIVTIKRSFIDPAQQRAYFNGQEAILLSIVMDDSFSVIDYVARVDQWRTRTQAQLPVGYQIDIATNQADTVEQKITAVSGNVAQTLIIVLMVVMLFLGMRTGLVVGSIVPFVMLATLAVMKFTGMVLEQLSLSTLIIALGLLVDNGIVIAEDFKRRLEQGVDRFQALCQGGRELAMPLLSSSLTTILFFLPLMLAEHVAGEFTRSISLVILITLLSSWIMALCITPVLCYYFIRVDKVSTDDTHADSKSEPETQIARFWQNASERFNDAYKALLQWLLTCRWSFMVTMVVIFVISLSGFSLIEKQFFPDSDRSQILIYVDMPQGTSAKALDAQMQQVFHWLDNKEHFPEIISYSGYSGFNGPRFVSTLNPEDAADNKGFVIVNLPEGTDLNAMVNRLHNGMIEQFPKVSARVRRMFSGPSDSATIKIQVKGPDKDVIHAKAQEIKALLYGVEQVKNVRTDWDNRVVKLRVDIDQQRARRAGVSSSDIATALQGHYDGMMVSEYRDGDTVIPMVFRPQASERSSIDWLRTAQVFSSSQGESLPLFQVADIYPEHQYGKIQRENLVRTVSVEASSVAITAEDMKHLIDDQVQALKADLPANHTIEYDGVLVDSAEASESLSANMPIMLGLVVILLVLQFNSYRRALIIILTIPLSIIGTVLGLLVMDAPFGFMVTLGIYSLAGIIINNSIVLIDRIDIERGQGVGDYQAIINACMTRLRPIAMTTITTIAGLLPLIISQDTMFYGMACVLAFGLGIGTLLTLGVVPVLYAIFFKVRSPNMNRVKDSSVKA